MTRPVRFIHAADIHLDAPFKGVDATDARVRRALVDATYESFERVVSLALEHAVDFIVLAGDSYDSRDKSFRAQSSFQAAMERLAGAGIDVFVAQGNHDPANGWSAGLPLPERVHYFPTDSVGRFEVERDGELLAAVYGRGYAIAAVGENLARGFRRDAGDPVAVAVLHANVGGDPSHEAYAPCSVEDLRAARMDYWALGHIHKPGRVADEPRAVYAGSPQGLNPKESGAHGCYLVEAGPGSVSETFHPTASVSWVRVEVDAGRLEGLDDVRRAIRETCASIRGEAGTPVVARIELVGRSPIHADLARGTNAAELLAEARDEQLAAEPWLWIDRLRDRTSPTLDLDEVRAGADFAADFVRLVDEVLADTAAVASLVREAAGPVEGAVGVVDLGSSAAEIVERARETCLDRLLADGETR
ncbi:MAG: metallophosphoesterase [Coriobacteriia bacterium]